MPDLSKILMLCAATLCFVSGTLVWRHVTIASGVLILAGILALAAGWFMRDSIDTTSESASTAPGASTMATASTRGTAGVWSSRARAMLAQASRLRDRDAPVSHARTIDRLSRGDDTANSEGSAS